MAQLHLRKYGVETTINFVLYGVDGIDLKVDAAHASGDTKIMKDEGAEANTTNGFTDEGQGYAIVLTATEMQAARIVLYVVDAATKVWLDTAIIIETYGNASAMHEFDLDTATQNVNVSTITNNAITAAAIATGAIDADSIADNAIDAGAIATDAITEIQSGLSTLTAAGVRTAVGLASANLDTQLADIETKVDDLETNIGTPSNLGGGATIAANLVDIEAQTEDIGTAGAGLSAVPWNAAWDAEVESEVADALAVYDPPTNAEMEARTLAAASYATAVALDAVDNFIDTEVAAIKAKTDNLPASPASEGNVTAVGNAVLALNNLSAAQVNAEVDTALADYDAPTHAELVSEINSVQVDIAALSIPSAAAIAAAVWGAATRLLTAGTNIVLAKGTGVTGFNDLSAAQVNAEVVDALATDTYAEPGQGAPAATASLAAKINYLYKAWRNRNTQTASQYSLYADNATTIDQKAAVTDDTVTFDRGEIGSGP